MATPASTPAPATPVSTDPASVSDPSVNTDPAAVESPSPDAAIETSTGAPTSMTSGEESAVPTTDTQTAPQTEPEPIVANTSDSE